MTTNHCQALKSEEHFMDVPCFVMMGPKLESRQCWIWLLTTNALVFTL